MSKAIITATVTQEGRFLKAITGEGKDVSNQIERPMRREAAETGTLLQHDPITNSWFFVGGTPTGKATHIAEAVKIEEIELVEVGSEHEVVKTFIHASPSLKPVELFMPDLKWKYLVRSAMRGKNIMMVGDSGSGKTLAAKYLVQALPPGVEECDVTEEEYLELLKNHDFIVEKI